MVIAGWIMTALVAAFLLVASAAPKFLRADVAVASLGALASNLRADMPLFEILTPGQSEFRRAGLVAGSTAIRLIPGMSFPSSFGFRVLRADRSVSDFRRYPRTPPPSPGRPASVPS